ncbi:MAG: hypothetical protein ABSB01_10115 [Streptosporangiaceae bacterium]|jgi:hypothetical protein
MYLTNEAAREHHQTMLASATEQRQVLRVRALGRATRRAERARRRLAHARQAAVQLRAALAAEWDT